MSITPASGNPEAGARHGEPRWHGGRAAAKRAGEWTEWTAWTAWTRNRRIAVYNVHFVHVVHNSRAERGRCGSPGVGGRGGPPLHGDLRVPGMPCARPPPTLRRWRRGLCTTGGPPHAPRSREAAAEDSRRREPPGRRALPTPSPEGGGRMDGMDCMDVMDRRPEDLPPQSPQSPHRPPGCGVHEEARVAGHGRGGRVRCGGSARSARDSGERRTSRGGWQVEKSFRFRGWSRLVGQMSFG